MNEYTIPKAESFIESEDSFHKLFIQNVTNSEHTNQSVGGSARNKSRAKRWLKEQDRALVKAIMDLEQQGDIISQFLFDNIHKNPATRDGWGKIKVTLGTTRSLNFLQSRYRKLIRNQKLNKHEKAYFSENYDKIPLEEFLLIFPGKTKATLEKLYSEIVHKNQTQQKFDQILCQKIHLGK